MPKLHRRVDALDFFAEPGVDDYLGLFDGLAQLWHGLRFELLLQFASLLLVGFGGDHVEHRLNDHLLQHVGIHELVHRPLGENDELLLGE